MVLTRVKPRRSLVGIVVLAALLVGLRAALPGWIVDHLNRSMEHLGDYRGHATDVDLSLYRGAYRVEGLTIVKRSGDVPVPLLQAPVVDLSIVWSALFHGRLVAEVRLRRPQFNFVDGPAASQDQTGQGVGWRRRIEGLSPFRINRVEVVDGVIAFRNPWSQPAVDLRARKVNGSVRNLTNVVDEDGRRDASVEARAHLLGGASAEFSASFDPFGALDDFRLDLRVSGIDLTKLNSLARAYARLDLAAGRGDFVMELDAADRRLAGYAKPLFTDMQILDWQQDVEQDQDDPLQLTWEAISGAIAALFRNQRTDRFATRIPIEGTLGAAEADRLDAIVNVLRNAFIGAYESHFEGTALDPAAGS